MHRRTWSTAALALALVAAQACAPAGPSGAPAGSDTAETSAPAKTGQPGAPAGTRAGPAGSGTGQPAPPGPGGEEGTGTGAAGAVPVPSGTPALVTREDAGWRLTFPAGSAVEWLGPRGPQQWQFRFETGGQPGEFLLDTARGEIRPAPLPWLEGYFGHATPLTLPDGRILGARGNIQGESHVRFILQDPAHGSEATVGGTDATGIAQWALAGETAVAYAFFDHDPARYLGALWQYDWKAQQHTRIAEQGWPVGRLADGRTVAQRGERIGEVVAWRAGAPQRLESLSPPGVVPFFASISPDGRRLVYFTAAPAPVSWWRPAVAHASPTRSGDRPNPTVDAIAVYDAATGGTRTTPLPLAGQVGVPTWDGAGGLVFTVQAPRLMDARSTAVLRLGPDGTLSTLYRTEGAAWDAGWDGSDPLVRQGEGVYRVTGGTAALLGRSGEIIDNSRLLGFPGPDGTTLLDTATGRRYRAPGLSLPAPPPARVRFDAFSPEGGWVAVLLQLQPQPVYRIVKLEPLRG